MKKETVYIDTDDDITVIIGKIKSATGGLVALVPPKRIGILQSVVNLRLLQRAAKQAKKHLVIVSNDDALRSLAATERIPIAKTLQSKPEIPEIATLATEGGDDIIDGSTLPIGDHERTADEGDAVDAAPGKQAKRQAVGAAAVASSGGPEAGAVKKPKKSQTTVPNFNRVRKRLIIFGILGVLLIGFLVWAIKFAPRATVTVKAKTNEEALNLEVALKSNAKPSLKDATLPIEKREVNTDISESITPTGSKNVGKKATGEVRIRAESDAMMDGSVTVPSGSTVTSSSGSEFTTDSEVVLRGSRGHYTGESVGVTARDRGKGSNGANGTASMSVDGVQSVSFQDATSGGTNKKVKILTGSDVAGVMAEVDKKLEDSGKKKELISQFSDDYIVLDDSFMGEKDGVKPSPAVGGEVKDSAKLEGKITYSLYAVPKSELEDVLDEHFKKAIKDEPNQRVYDNGADKAEFMTATGEGGSWKATLVATAKIGPDINDDQVKETAKEKKYDEIRSSLEGISGVEEVKVDFWPFWVNKAPLDEDKITVVFKVNGKD